MLFRPAAIAKFAVNPRQSSVRSLRIAGGTKEQSPHQATAHSFAVHQSRRYSPTMLRFTKMNGAGNDFVMIDNRAGEVRLSSKQIVRICDRHGGVGADGILL